MQTDDHPLSDKLSRINDLYFTFVIWENFNFTINLYHFSNLLLKNNHFHNYLKL